MATELGRVKSTAAGKYDVFVASQLKQAETRMRMLDLSAGLLGFAVLSLAYIMGMVLCDSKILLSQHTRQLSLYVYLAGAAVYLFFVVVRPLRMRVNPYYAARQVEHQLPHAKNSIVNWVDLHKQPLPPAIRGALGQRAAKDLAHIDLDSAISGRRASWMGGLAGLFAVAFIVSFFLIGPAPFLSLLKRTFNPFEAVGVSTRTRLTLLKPEGGNTTITVGRGVNFVVDVSGKVPNPKAADAVKLLYRYEEGDPWLERRLVPEKSGEWTASLSAIDVKNGFWYKITGGDAATEEYQVSVRAAVAITDFLSTYHFRPYVARADEVRRERELKALRGAEVLLRVRTNRALREGRLEFEGNGRAGVVNPPVAFVPGEVDAHDSQTLLVRFVLDEDGKYRLNFTSTEGEAYRDPVSFSVTAIPDQPPTVELTKPGKDIRLPVDALLHLEGKASDDIGVQSLVLRMRVIGGDKLRGQPYRSNEELRLAEGGYPSELEYKDFVDLSRVHSESEPPGSHAPRGNLLRGGMELEYWLEASDACDYPRANVAESKHYRVLLTEPEKNEAKTNQEKKQAEKDKKQHEQKQDQKRQKENQERQQQRQEQQARNKEEENKSKNADKGGAGEKSQSKESGQADNSGGKEDRPKENDGQQGDGKDGSGEANSGDQKSELSKEDQKTEEKIKKALEKKQAGENGGGDGKPEKGDQGQDKGQPQNKPDGGDGSGDNSKGENKDSGKKNAKQSGEGKDKGEQQAGGDPAQGDGKGEKKEPKDGDSKNSAGKAGENKSKPESAPKKGEDNSGGASQSSKDADPRKDKPTDKGQQSTKDGNQSTKEKGQQSKAGGKDDGKAERKQGSPASENKPSAQGETKPDAQAKSEKKDRSDNKQGSDSSARNATAKEIEDLARALQSKDAREREKAKQQLQRIANEANDPKAREKAREALEKVGKPDGASGKQAPKKDNDANGKPSPEHQQGEKGEDSKGVDPSKEKSNGENANPGQKNEQRGKNGQGSSTDEGKQGSPTAQDGTPGGGGDRRSGKGAAGAPPSQPKQPEKPRDHRAAQMQLEDFAKKVNKDILKEAGVSEEAWKNYLDAKRKQLTPREKPRTEVPSAPQQANQLPSMGGRTIEPAAAGQDDTSSPNRGQPPPGYRDSFRKFTQQMSK